MQRIICLALALGLVSLAGADLPKTSAVLSLEGNDWKVASDPGNVGRDQKWWQGPTPEAKSVRVPGILQEALPGYHGVAWYWKDFVRHPWAIVRQSGRSRSRNLGCGGWTILSCIG
jgi:hypothetical protein